MIFLVFNDVTLEIRFCYEFQQQWGHYFQGAVLWIMAGFGLGRSWGGPALLKGQKYQMIKTQTEP